MEERKPATRLLSFSLFVLFFYLIAVPLPRTLAIRHPKIGKMEVADQIQGVTSRKVVKGEKGGAVMERMEIEVNDYPISGANSRHDPKSPGKP